MFNNINETLKTLSWVNLILGVIGGVLLCILALIAESFVLFIYAIVCCMVCFVQSAMLYGFAELITCVKDIRNRMGNELSSESIVDELPEL